MVTNAQCDSSDRSGCFHLAPYVGINFQQHRFWEAGLQWARFDSGSPCSTPTYVAYRAGIEYSDAPEGRILAPKIGASGEAYFLAFRGSIAAYMQNGLVDARAIPEIGFSLPLCLMQITYGWNIPLTQDRVGEVTSHRFAISISLDRRIFQ